jgi:predicted O-methyltransferase YrrM
VTHPVLHHADVGWRARPLFALLGLRPPLAQHTPPEGELLRRLAAGAECVVELGVAEGASAYELRKVIAPRGTLYLVDPYHLGHFFGRSAAELVARRLVESVERGRVVWMRQMSHDAVTTWTREIDFLFIDADHAYEAVRRDWNDWTPFVRTGGVVALHDALAAAEWVAPGDGPARLLESVRADPAWELVATADSTAALRRR